MFVCLCHGITDKKIRALVREGIKDVQQIQAHCKAGKNCGTCLCQLKQIIAESSEAENQPTDWKKTGSDK